MISDVLLQHGCIHHAEDEDEDEHEHEDEHEDEDSGRACERRMKNPPIKSRKQRCEDACI